MIIETQKTCINTYHLIHLGMSSDHPLIAGDLAIAGPALVSRHFRVELGWPQITSKLHRLTGAKQIGNFQLLMITIVITSKLFHNSY